MAEEVDKSLEVVEKDAENRQKLEDELREYQLQSSGYYANEEAVKQEAAEADAAAEQEDDGEDSDELTAQEVIEKIEASDDPEEVSELGEDDRVTVQRAAEKRLDELEEEDDSDSE